MRKELKKFEEKRMRFKGTFIRFGTKSGFKYPLKTILLSDIKIIETNKKITDHLWFNFTKGFEVLDIKERDVVCFDARVKEYVKGYKGYDEELSMERPLEIDYKLSHPTKISKIIKSNSQ